MADSESPAAIAAADASDAVVCPYLDTIQRTALDFDFEVACSVTLQTGPHIYACCVCGRYFRGRGPHTPAYTHAVDASHFVFLHLTRRVFYCLPDNYEIKNDVSLNDIRQALHPTYTPRDVTLLDEATDLSRDLFGRLYRPGFVGLNNLHKTDGINSVVQALAHVRPLRDYFLQNECDSGEYSEASSLSNTNATANANANTANNRAYVLTQCFGALVRQLWSNQRFKSHVDPHQLVHAITVASHSRYKIGTQIEVGEFTAWFLHQLHVGTGGISSGGRTGSSDKGRQGAKRKRHKGNGSSVATKSIVQEIFQGKVRVTTREAKRKTSAMDSRSTDENVDDRGGSDDEDVVTPTGHNGGAAAIQNESSNNGENGTANESSTANGTAMSGALTPAPVSALVDESVVDSDYMQLTLDLTEKPLFRDQDGGLVIPQEALVTVLKKFDGVTVSDTLGRSIQKRTKSGKGSALVPQRRTYQLLELPDVLILHFSRFPKHRTPDQRRGSNKNPTIVVFPVKNLNLTNYVHGGDGGGDDNGTSNAKSDGTVYKYDLVANIVHDSPADVGREGTAHDPLQEGSYKCHVQHRGGNKQWYEMQDLHVQDIMPQQIGVSESYLLILERNKT